MAPVAMRMTDARARSGRRINAVSSVSCHAGGCSRFPALQPNSRADAVAATASRPAYRDDRETPLVAGRDVLVSKTDFCKYEYFDDRRLTCGWCVLPGGQR
ncbi:hypothetical protein ACVWYH_000348 [Bradyrhizobium sp. GM24.11]|jgi:hypothetical protein